MSGVGTELSKLIPSWAVSVADGCGCDNYAAKMDKWGLRGCQRRRNEIVAHLLDQSDLLIPAFRLIPLTMKKIVAERLLNKAIKSFRDSLSP